MIRNILKEEDEKLGFLMKLTSTDLSSVRVGWGELGILRRDEKQLLSPGVESGEWGAQTVHH